MKEYIRQEFETSRQILEASLADHGLQEALERVIQACIASLRAGNRILFAGNGGSAADAQHFAAELVSRFYYDRPGLPCLALTTDTSILTAVGNDYGYEFVFARQVEANGRSGDVFIGISTSGSSPNILRALEVARKQGLITAGFTGALGREMSGFCDHVLKVPSTSTPRIQEIHGVLGHILCAAIERALYPRAA
ncbi:MAG: D-sedoheptulose 7-phosphate isomerase [Gammaproteobacteria bacterium]